MVLELRLILLGAGVVGLLLLFLWERRRASLPPEDAPTRTGDRFEPRFDSDGHGGDGPGHRPPAIEPRIGAVPRDGAGGDADAAPDGPGDGRAELPAMRATPDRQVPHGDPPVVTIDDLPTNLDTVVLESPASYAAQEAPPAPEPATSRRRRRVANPPVVQSTHEAEPEVPPATAAPAAPDPEPAPATQPPEPEPVAAPPPRQQRIVAIRLVARDGARIEGRELRAALIGEGLEFGRHSIYHRQVGGPRPLFSVASLVEPGSFDANRMDSMRFPGVSLFAVFPGSLPAPQCFDDMIAAARRLADRLGAVLQDDSGSSLTGQRILSLREDLVHFEHLLTLGRSRAPG
jgi:cell division protein ZipA